MQLNTLSGIIRFKENFSKELQTFIVVFLCATFSGLPHTARLLGILLAVIDVSFPTQLCPLAA